MHDLCERTLLSQCVRRRRYFGRDHADRLANEFAAGVGEASDRAARLPRRPRVYFEEWDNPMISGIAWVSELIEGARASTFSPIGPRRSVSRPHERSSSACPTSSSARNTARNSSLKKSPHGPVSIGRLPAERRSPGDQIAVDPATGSGTLSAGLAELQRVIEMAARK